MQNYVVLRDVSRVGVADASPSRMRDFGPSIQSLTPPEPKIELEALDHAGRTEMLRDPGVVSLARDMPISLIEPVTEAQAADGEGATATAAAAGAQAWGIAATGADRSQFTGAGTTVAVLDTGIDRTHPAFAGMALVEQDFSGQGDGDRNGHGTHCAGTIFGRDVGGARIGVARGVERAAIGKILDDAGRGSSGAAFAGIEWALAQGAQVISMSIGFDFTRMVQAQAEAGWPVDLATSAALEGYRANLRMFDTLMAMIRAREAWGAGAVLVAAAGNESRRHVRPDFEIAASLPAAAEGVVSVAAAGESPAGWFVAPFSNTLARICGPGVAVVSAQTGGGLKPLDGTSMACPHVAGVAALWWEFVRRSGLPPQAPTVVAKLLATARQQGFVPGTDVADVGVGFVTAP